MLWFDKERIPEGQWPFLPTVYRGLRNTQDSLVDRLDLTEGTGHVLITGCLQAYKQAVLRRALDLGQAAVAAWNAGQPVGALVCGRALLETIATFHALLTRAQAAADAGDWSLIGRLVDAYAFSVTSGPRKRARVQERPPRIGEIALAFIRATQPGKEQFWEQVCDDAHPNGERMLRLGGDLRDGYYIARAADNEPMLFVALFNCLYSCCWLVASAMDFDILLERVRTGGDLPPDHELIVKRNLIDNVVERVAASVGPMRPGPARRKAR